MTPQLFVFISHAPEDDARIAPLRTAFDLWHVPYAIDSHAHSDEGALAADVQDNLRRATIFLRIATAATARSYWMSLERSVFLNLQAEDFRAGNPDRRKMVSLVIDPEYQFEPFDYTGTVIDITKKPQTVWLKELRAALGLPPIDNTGQISLIAEMAPRKTNRRGFLRAGMTAAAVVVAAGAGGTALWLHNRQSGATTVKNPHGPRPAVIDPNLIWYYQTGDQVNSSPAVANGIVVVGSYDGFLYALNAHSGNQLWSDDFQRALDWSPAIAQNLVFMTSSNSKAYALDLQTGKQLWSVEGLLGSPYLGNGLVYFGAIGSVVGLDPATNNQTWFGDTANQDVFTELAAGSAVYATTSGGSIFAFDAQAQINLSSAPQGKLLWSTTTPGKQAIVTTPTIAAGVLCVGSQDNSIYGIDTATGTILWSYATGGPVVSSPATDNTLFYIGSRDKNVYAFEPKTGRVRWKYTTGAQIVSSPAVVNGLIYIGSSDHKLYVLSASDGTVVRTYQTSGPIGSSPTVVDGVVYVGSADHYIYAFKAV